MPFGTWSGVRVSGREKGAGDWGSGAGSWTQVDVSGVALRAYTMPTTEECLALPAQIANSVRPNLRLIVLVNALH